MKIERSHKKRVHKYIKENLKKGYSLAQIKNAFLTYGYDPNYTENLIANYKIRNTLVKTSPLLLVLLISFSLIFFLKPQLTTLAVLNEDKFYVDIVSLSYNESATYIWNLEKKGILKSIALNGQIKINGTAKIYLEHENKTYLIFDSKKLEEKSLQQITGFLISIDSIKVETEGNLTSEEQSFLDDLIVDINKTKNNIEIEVEIKDNETNLKLKGDLTEEQNTKINLLIDILKKSKENIKIKIESEFEEVEIPEQIINDTINETLINETLPLPINVTIPLNGTLNITPVINETVENISANKINIDLEYKNGSVYDINDDGIENIDNVIDLTIENTDFNWDVNESNLCTRWETFSVEDEESTFVCYGASRCCQFVDLLATKPIWNEPFFSVYGQYGTTFNNVVSAQVLYVDYELTGNEPYAEIYSSDWKDINTKFHQDFVSFENMCIETCALPNLNATSYELTIKIEDTEIILDSISYTIEIAEIVNTPPILLNNFTKLEIFKDQIYTINLSEYFYDEDNDTLIFKPRNNSDINISIINETATLRSINFTGKTYLFFTANDTIDIVVSNVFEVEIREKVQVLPSGLKSLRKIIGLI